ncbi:Uma2 family endonuclease [Romeria aff. gracilis LEGE 07310]|uniref:Uma2 family endonuclease n=1 Tax=Vasconcelosia minhoensis LEGE 07310 TaxID=915328 RepID=A0A8J7AC03_9CYAN|nr:Uma2 family endonuclease [Romeria gracilis]MBE9077516.1 Uma2 family endonuclease [Romeria aff. gracilis LEGE 07310]
MNKIISPIRWTIHDLDALPENEGIRREIIDGELFVTRAPHWKHQDIIANIITELKIWSKNHSGKAFSSPGIIRSEEDNVIPDLVWVSNERLTGIADEAGHFTGFPELVVEVLSAGERNIYRDKQAKLKLYSQGEAQEYWIVDRFSKQLEVYRQQKGKLVLVEILTEADSLTSPLFANFSLTISQIFA